MRRLLLIAALISSAGVYAANRSTGSWSARVDGNRLQVTLWTSDSEHPTANLMGFSVELANVKLVSAGTFSTAGGDVRFVLDRAAGTLDFESRFGKEAGAGHCRLTSHPEFVAEMEVLGDTAFATMTFSLAERSL